jgi:CubicO group peptidase (beta-lactamase class C family)
MARSGRIAFIFSMIVQVASPARAAADEYFPGSSWRSSDPAAQGMDAACLSRMQGLYGNAGSIVVVRNGYLVSGPGVEAMKRDVQHVHSCAKSVVSLLAGIAIGEGLVSGADEPVTRFLSGRAEWDAVTLRHLLSMRSGIEWNDAKRPTDSELMSGREDWLGYIASKPLVSEPGVVWNYCSGGTQLLAFALEKACGRSLSAYADEKLFSALGIRPAAWWNAPAGGAGGPSGGYGYGYSWWIYEGLGLRAFKACGQYGAHRVDIAVLPELDIVVVLAGGNLDDRGILERYAIPAANPEREGLKRKARPPRSGGHAPLSSCTLPSS